MENVNASEVVHEYYADYAAYVNRVRALPDSRDGMKAVQRRVVAALIEMGHHGDWMASASVVGDTNKKFHPHGDSSIYGAMVNMVTSPLPLLEGYGNFGYSKGLSGMPPAAQRYTSVRLSESAVGRYVRLYKFTDFEVNENDYDEPIYLPSPIPYCLENGSIGIGVSASTNIPALSYLNIKNIARAILRNEKPPMAWPKAAEGGDVHMDEEQLERLNTVGIGTATHSAKVEWVHDEESGNNALCITEVPNVVNLSKLFVLLKDAIEENLITVRDDSDESTRVIVYRNPRIKRITDDELERIVRWVCNRRVTYRCVVAHEGYATLMTPIDMIRTATDHAVTAYVRWLESEIGKTTFTIKFERVKNTLAKMIQDDESAEDIMKALDLSEDEYRNFIGRPISSLRAAAKDTAKLEEYLENLNSWITDPRESYLEVIGL